MDLNCLDGGSRWFHVFILFFVPSTTRIYVDVGKGEPLVDRVLGVANLRRMRVAQVRTPVRAESIINPTKEMTDVILRYPAG